MFGLAWKGLYRRPIHHLIALAGMSAAVATLACLSMLAGGYRRSLANELDHMGLQLMLVPLGCPYDAESIALRSASWPCYLDASYLKEVAAVPGVASAAPAFMTAHYDERGEPHVLVGVTSNILALRPSWRIEGEFPTHGGQVLIGAEVAHECRPTDAPVRYDPRPDECNPGLARLRGCLGPADCRRGRRQHGVDGGPGTNAQDRGPAPWAPRGATSSVWSCSRQCCPAGKCNGRPSPARWSTRRSYCSRMNRRATSTARRGTRSLPSFGRSTAKA